MKRFIAFLCAFLLQLCGCRSPQVVGVHLSKATAIDGLSPASAIVVPGRNQRDEATWLEKTFPGFRIGGKEMKGNEEVVYFPHRTEMIDGHVFSVWTIQLADGTIRPVFFDITSYVGKP